jgi:hypothetical protein
LQKNLSVDGSKDKPLLSAIVFLAREEKVYLEEILETCSSVVVLSTSHVMRSGVPNTFNISTLLYTASKYRMSLAAIS